MSDLTISAEDPRNAGIIEYLKPEPVTLETIAHRLTAASKGKTEAEILARARQVLESIESRPHRPDPPLSQPVERAPHPWFGLGTHPDLVEALWKLDEALPERCRWLLWGYPVLVHPRSGVVFAAARGTIGLFLRLPSESLAKDEAETSKALSKPRGFGAAMSDWHLVTLHGASLVELGRRAYDIAEASSELPKPAKPSP